jgi:hypothetical protein
MGGAYSTYGGEERRIPKGRDNLGDPGIEGKNVLRWFFRKGDVGVWTGSSWLKTETGSGLF